MRINWIGCERKCRSLKTFFGIEIIFYCFYSLYENYYCCLACDRDVNYDGQVMLSIWNQFVSSLHLPSETDVKHTCRWDERGKEMHKKTTNERKASAEWQQRTTRILIILMDNRKTRWNSKSTRKEFSSRKTIRKTRKRLHSTRDALEANFAQAPARRCFKNCFVLFQKFLLNVWLICILDCYSCYAYKLLIQFSMLLFASLFGLINFLVPKTESSERGLQKKNLQQFIFHQQSPKLTLEHFAPIPKRFADEKLSRVNIP